MKRTQRLVWAAVIGLVVCLGAMLPMGACAEKMTATFREGVSPDRDYDVQDAELRAAAPDASIEPNPRWNVGFSPAGIEREVVIFPIKLPAGAMVTSVRLDVWKVGAPTGSFGDQRQVDLHLITNPLFTSESAVSWNIIGMGIRWKTPGGDYAPAVLSSITPSNTVSGTKYTFPSSGPFLAAVRSALAGDGKLRLLLRAADEKKIGVMAFFASDGHSEGDEVKPLLTIEYTSMWPGSAPVKKPLRSTGPAH